jgi:signal transduction histidine kinase
MVLLKDYGKLLFLIIGLLGLSFGSQAQEIKSTTQNLVYESNIIFYIIIIIFLGVIIFLANSNYKMRKVFSVAKKQDLDLKKKQNAIISQDQELAWQNEEIASQNEELLQIQQELTQQSQYVEDKNNELEKFNRRLISNEKVMLKAVKKLKEKKIIIKQQNEHLEEEVSSRTYELSQKNQELIDYTNQLEQFAFVTGHNLRAPIARLLGLVSIMDLENFSNPDNKIYIKNLEIVTKELDSIITDLNTVLEVKRTNQVQRERINFKEKVNKIALFLQQIYHNVQFDIHTDFIEINEIMSINIYWESILYNLFSNSIKYRHPDRDCEIKLETTLHDNTFTFTVKDNGVGIDLETYKDKIFGLYKRFHQHVEGKGLGLHLVRLQVESLGGKITVESILDKETMFTIVIPNIDKISQITSEENRIN